MRAIGAPASTWAFAAVSTDTTVPANGAVIVLSIFMLSTTVSRAAAGRPGVERHPGGRLVHFVRLDRRDEHRDRIRGRQMVASRGPPVQPVVVEAPVPYLRPFEQSQQEGAVGGAARHDDGALAQ